MKQPEGIHEGELKASEGLEFFWVLGEGFGITVLGRLGLGLKSTKKLR